MNTNRDFRSLSKDVQEAFRKQAVQLVLEKGYTQQEAADVVGVHRPVVARWLKRHRENPESGLSDGRVGRPRPDLSRLTESEIKKIKNWISDSCPDQLKLPFALWTSKAIKELIRRKLGKTLGDSTIRLYMKRWGYTSQKPLFRAKQRDSRQIRKWLNETYPNIAFQAKQEGALILWSDETGLNNQDQIGKGYALKGQTPVVTRTTKKVTTSLISAISNRGDTRFMIYEGSLRTQTFLEFLKRLIKNQDQKIYLIVDNLKVHHAKQVKSWEQKNRKKIRLFYLPAYAPEYNPDEYLNNNLKQKMRRKPIPDSVSELKTSLRATMKSIQRQPELVKSYFRHKDVKYAA